MSVTGILSLVTLLLALDLVTRAETHVAQPRTDEMSREVVTLERKQAGLLKQLADLDRLVQELGAI